MDRPARRGSAPRGASLRGGRPHPKAARAARARGVDRGVLGEPELSLRVRRAPVVRGRGLLQVGRLADVGPELVDREAAHAEALRERRADELVHVESRVGGHELAELWLQDIDASVHEVTELGFLADPRHARPVDLDEAVAELVGGLDDADRQVVPLGAVEGDELAEVHPREEIRVRDDELALQLRKRGGDRARGPERTPVAHVADGHAKAPPVAEVALDQLRLVTDREDDPAEALRREVLYQCGEDRPAGDLDERLRDVAGDVAQPAAETARHDEDRDRLLGGPRHPVEELDVEDAAAFVDDGYLTDRPREHERDDLVVGHVPLGDDRLGLHDRARGAVEARPGEDGAARIAVGHGADELAARSDEERDARHVAVDRLHRRADRRGARDDRARRIGRGTEGNERRERHLALTEDRADDGPPPPSQPARDEESEGEHGGDRQRREGDPVQAGRDVERGDDERRRERRGAEVDEIARAAEVPALPVDAERRVAADLDRGRERRERDRLLGLGYLDAAADPERDGNEVRDGDGDEIEPGEPRDRHRTYSAARSASGRSRSHATVRSRPSRSETRGAQPSSSRARVGSAMSRSTSLDAGRTRVWSSSMRRGTSAISAISEARSPMAISTPVPSCTVRPTTCGMVPARTKPATVSLTNVKSRVGDREPRRTGPPRISCAAIVGMTARSDCRGP